MVQSNAARAYDAPSSGERHIFVVDEAELSVPFDGSSPVHAYHRRLAEGFAMGPAAEDVISRGQLGAILGIAAAGWAVVGLAGWGLFALVF